MKLRKMRGKREREDGGERKVGAEDNRKTDSIETTLTLICFSRGYKNDPFLE